MAKICKTAPNIAANENKCRNEIAQQLLWLRKNGKKKRKAEQLTRSIRGAFK